MGRADKVSFNHRHEQAKGYKLVDFGLPLGSEISDKGKDYQVLGTEIAHLLQPRWIDTP